MKIRAIENTMNINTAVNYLTNLILSDDTTGVILDTEFGKIPVSIPGVSFHDASDPFCGIKVYPFNEAPYSAFHTELLRSGDTDYKWFVVIPTVSGQSRDLSTMMAARALTMTMMLHIIDLDYVENVDNIVFDAALYAYWKIYESKNGYGYPDFNREIIKLSTPVLQRHGINYRNFLLSNREILRTRRLAAGSHLNNARSKMLSVGFSFDVDFGGEFYTNIFALCANFNYSIPKAYVTMYNKIAGRDIRGMIRPVDLIRAVIGKITVF